MKRKRNGKKAQRLTDGRMEKKGKIGEQLLLSATSCRDPGLLEDGNLFCECRKKINVKRVGTGVLMALELSGCTYMYMCAWVND